MRVDYWNGKQWIIEMMKSVVILTISWKLLTIQFFWTSYMLNWCEAFLKKQNITHLAFQSSL
jgi:hypothetical protein